MEKKSSPTKVLLYQSVGFLVIIAVSWLVEFLGLRTLVLGDHPYISDFRESTLEMVIILAVWLIVSGSTRRVLEHLQRLERFMLVCAWCRRIKYKGRWIPFEEFLQQGFDTPTSHGICLECLDVQKKANERAKNQALAQEAHSHR